MNVLVETAGLLDHDPRFLVLLAGTRRIPNKLAKLIKHERIQNCLLLGSTSYHSMPSLYQAADLFVLISKGGDGFPVSILEAWASGLPIVSTTHGEHTEVVRQHNIGFLETRISPYRLARLLEECAANSSQLSRMGEEVRLTLLSRPQSQRK